jgi:hypothetical protein
MTDEEIRKLMDEDPEAAKFLGNMLPSGDGDSGSRRFNAQIVRPGEEGQGGSKLSDGMGGRVSKSIRIKTTIKKQQPPADAYKWPYFDSYVPNLPMK